MLCIAMQIPAIIFTFLKSDDEAKGAQPARQGMNEWDRTPQRPAGTTVVECPDQLER
jgi:hypothetical protein